MSGPRLSRRAARALCAMHLVVDAEVWAELREKGCVTNSHMLTDLGRRARERLGRLGFHVFEGLKE